MPEADDGLDLMPVARSHRNQPRVEPGFGSPSPMSGAGLDEDDFDEADYAATGFDDDEFSLPSPAERRPVAQARVEAPAPRPAEGARVRREAQASLIRGNEFEMPSLHFLAEPKVQARDATLSADALEQNARL